MKANAKKLLALIMAMVMVLSLAAPAMATSSEAGRKATLTAQDSALVASFTDVGKRKGTYNGDYEVATGTDVIVSGNVTKTPGPDGVEVKLTKQATNLIGEKSTRAEYKVTYSGTYKEQSYTAGGTVEVGKAGNVKTLVDVTSDWKTLQGSDMVFGDTTQEYQVQGSAYTETIPSTGKVNVFFKLAKVENEVFQKDELYFVARNQNSSVTMSDALANAIECDVYGKEKTTAPDVASKAAIKVNTSEEVAPAYDFVVQNEKDLSFGTIDKTQYDKDEKKENKPVKGGKFTTIKFATDTDTGKAKTTGSFQVSIEDKAQEWRNRKTSTAKVYVTDVAAAKTILVDALDGKVTVNDVTAAGGNFLTVSVTALPTAESYKSDKYSKNILTYKGKAGLIDQSKDGWYNGADAEGLNGSVVSAGTEFLGPVAVKASDVPNDGTYTVSVAAVGGFYTFESVKAMKEGIIALSCKNAKSIPYAQAILNYKVGGETNILLQGNSNLNGAISKEGKYGKTVEVDLARDWASKAFTTPAAAFVKTGTLDVAATSHTGTLVDTVSFKNATCKEAGTKTTKTVCSECNKVVAEKTETLAIVADPVKVNTAKTDKDANGNAVEKIWFEKGVDTMPTSTHYINKAETTSAVDPTTKKVTVTTVYTCNLGVVHDELTRSVVVDKANLQGAGKWNLATWTEDYDILHTTVSAAGLAQPWNMFGNNIEIADSDIDNENLPLNRATSTDLPKGDPVFKFNQKDSLWDMSDGTYTLVKSQSANVYANSKALPTEKTYQAVATVKNINYAKFTCLTGSATIQVDVYEQTAKYKTTDSIATSGKLDAEKLAKALSDGKLTKIQTFTKDVVIPASANHRYTSGATVCDVCGTSRESAQSKSQIFTADTITVSNLTYTGKVALPKVVVKDTDGNMLIKGIDYEIGYEDENATAVGEYTVVIKGIGDYVGNRIAKTYKIVKAAPAAKAKKQTLKVSVAKKTYKVKTLKKKAQKFTTKLSGAKTKVTWKSSNKKVTVKVSGKKATITVKKGTKKGTYKVTATAKKTSAYKKGTVTVKVIVK